MFNRRFSDDLATASEIIRSAVSLARVPGQSASIGNAADAYAAFTSPLLPASEGAPGSPHGGASGIDAGGNEFFPFVLGIDTFETQGAYWMKGYPTINYGN